MHKTLCCFFRTLLIYVFLSQTVVSSAQVITGESPDGFESLWDEVYQHARADLPKSQRQVLQRIMEKASKENNYGQLLTSQLMDASLAVSLSPDSFEVVVSKLKNEEQMAAADTAKAAVYRLVLSRLLQIRNFDLEGAGRYARSAVENPEALAATTALRWQPFLVRGSDSSIFDDDLLSAVGFASGNAKAVYDYYAATDNRRAQLISAYMMLESGVSLSDSVPSRQNERSDDRWRSIYIHDIDSLMACYADLPECGELAISRLKMMQASGKFTVRQQMDFIDEALQKWGSWKNAVALEEKREQLIAPHFLVNFGQENITPSQPLTLRLTKVRNPGTMTVRASRLEVNQNNSKRNMSYEEFCGHIVERDVKNLQISPADFPPYEFYDTTVVVGRLPVGIYLVEVESDSLPQKPVYEIVHVSDVSLLVLPLPGNQLRLAVVNTTSGQPLPHAKIDVMDDDKRLATLKTNSRGEVVYRYKKDQDSRLEAYTDADKASVPTLWHYYYGGGGSKDKTIKITCFTDRAIYRPGQTVNLAILAMTNISNETFKPYRKGMEVTVSDGAGNDVVDTILVADAFGTAFIPFTIPANCAVGDFDVEVDIDDWGEGYYSFQVEEYKRPTFDIELLPLKAVDVHHDKVVVRGVAKALSGAPVTGATVAVGVKRSLQGIGRNLGYYNEPVFADTILTDEQGAFQISLPTAVPDIVFNHEDSLRAEWSYRIVALVTDRAGESHENSTTVGRTLRPYTLSVSSASQVEARQTLRLTAQLKDRWGVPVDTLVQVWTDQSADITHHRTNQPLSLPVTGTLAEVGYHQLHVGFGELEKEVGLKVVDFAATRLGRYAKDFFAQSASSFPSDGGKVNVQIGSSLDSVHVLYTIIAEDKVVESGTFKLSDAIYNRSFAYKKSYGKGVVLSYAFMKDGQLFTHCMKILAPIPDKLLKMQWTTFRNKLQPGQEETWTLRVQHADGSPAKAQLLATLYDASLDPLVKHQWSFSPFTSNNLYNNSWSVTSRLLSSSTPSYREPKSVFTLSLNSFDNRLMRLWGDTTVLHRILSSTRILSSAGEMRGSAGQVVGVVCDEEGSPIIGASVIVRGGNGTVTDFNGRFSLPVNGKGTIVVNYIGYEPQVMDAASGNYLEIFLEPSYNALNEVVVVGYGVNKKTALTGSVMVRGVAATRGAPGVLYVVDGHIVDDLSGVDVSIISGIEIMESASATAIYGNRAANGVVVISTQGAPMENAEETLNHLLSSLVPPPVVVRENFEETAFFHPRLMPDANGEFTISFTLPESVTSWRFLGLAHDREMNFELTEALAVAQKEVMVQPNLPRFIRVGDQSVFSARVANLSDKVKEGVAELTLSDMVTGAVVWSGQQPFRIESGSTEGIDFAVSPFKETSALVCRTVVRGDSFSDGEQQMVPVVPARELVTSSYPFVMKGKQQLDYPLDRLLPTDADQRSLTFEYTAHPEWLAVAALPVLSATTDDDAIAQASVYYANQMGRLLASSPAIRQAIEAWKNDTTLNSPLESALKKNTSLKEMMLSETPWMLYADGEQAMKRNFAAFFDTPSMDRKSKDALAQLKKLQNADGGWAWCQGMGSSVYTSIMVMEMLARIQMQKPTKDCATLLEKGMAFLLPKVHKEVEEMKADTVKGSTTSPSEWLLHYLYISALMSPQQHDDNADHQYLLSFLNERKVDLSIYGKAACAVLMLREGYGERAMEYLKSLKEYAVTTEEMGMFFDTPKALRSWRNYEIPTVAMAIEAILMLTPEDTASVALMKQWLLMQKRTQMWESNVATVEAIYALFRDSRLSFASSAVPVGLTLAIDGEQVAFDDASAGVGYVRTVVDHGDLRQCHIEKDTDQLAWGALYGQSLQAVETVADDSQGLVVKRELLLPDRPLRVGDKMKVRIIVKADRNYDFVQIFDRRPACLEPVNPLSSYFWGYYSAKKDNVTTYYFDKLGKGELVIEEEYYVDREGDYTSGTCVARCAYAPEFNGISGAYTLKVGR